MSSVIPQASPFLKKTRVTFYYVMDSLINTAGRWKVSLVPQKMPLKRFADLKLGMVVHAFYTSIQEAEGLYQPSPELLHRETPSQKRKVY